MGERLPLAVSILEWNARPTTAYGSPAQEGWKAGFVVPGSCVGTLPLVPSLRTARDGHTATLLSNGNVLVIGGGASAELFEGR